MRKKRNIKAAWYAAGFILVLASTVVGLLVLGGSDWYIRHADYPALGGIGYSHRSGRQDCEILIYGDSTAGADLDPLIIQQRTGLKTCNVAEWTTVQRVVGSDPPLEEYLHHNKAPRFLITTYAPYYLRPDIPPMTEDHIEGVWYAWRYRRWWPLRSLRFFTWTTRFLPWELRSLLVGSTTGLLGKKSSSYDPRSLREEHQGYWPFPQASQTHCVTTQLPFAAQRWDESVATFRRKYESAATTVFVNASPIADCDPHFSQYQQLLRGLYSNTLEALPIHDFSNADIHLGPEGAQIYSEQVAHQLLALGNKLRSGRTGPHSSGPVGPDLGLNPR